MICPGKAEYNQCHQLKLISQSTADNPENVKIIEYFLNWLFRQFFAFLSPFQVVLHFYLFTRHVNKHFICWPFLMTVQPLDLACEKVP